MLTANLPSTGFKTYKQMLSPGKSVQGLPTFTSQTSKLMFMLPLLDKSHCDREEKNIVVCPNFLKKLKKKIGGVAFKI